VALLTAMARPLRRTAALVHDPALVSQSKAGRAALVVPAALALGTALGIDPQARTFLVFPTFALLVMADFGAPLWPRLRAYLATLVLGRSSSRWVVWSRPMPG
jgi:hypothetical protein